MSTLINSDTQYIDEETRELINNGFIYIGLDGLDAKLNLAVIYSDRELTTILANPQRTGSDGRSVNKIWVDGKYSMKVENSANVQKLNRLTLGELTQTGSTNLVNVQGADSLVADASPTITELTNNQIYILTAAANNTGLMSLTIDLTPTWPIKKHHDNDMKAGDIEAGQTLAVIFNETDSIFELMTNSAIGPVNLDSNQTIAGVKTFSDTLVTSKGVDVASAATLTLGADGNSFDITGTTTITSIATLGAGAHVTLQFDDVLTLTHHATDLILPDAVDIITAAGDIAVFYEYATGDWRCISYTKYNRYDVSAGHLSGLTLSNDVDADHDINITSGITRDSADNYTLRLSSEITKQIDAPWVVGDDVGGLFSGSVVIDTWYHVFLIRKDSDGSIDAGFDTSVTAANIPAGYTAYRRIGSVLTDGSSNITQFYQHGNEFLWKTPEVIFAATAPTSKTEYTMSTPLGVECLACVEMRVVSSFIDVSGAYMRIHSPYATDAAVTASNANFTYRADNTGGESNTSEITILTNTLSQMSFRADAAVTGCGANISRYTDFRGQ